MIEKIGIIAGDVSAVAELLDSKTSEAIWDALPIENTVNTWGERYILIFLWIQLWMRRPKRWLKKASWVTGRQGKAFCIFFGPTPASQGDKIRPASAVNIVGKVKGNVEVFKSVRDGTRIKLERIRN